MDDKKKKRSFLDDFKIVDQNSCERAIRNGAIASFISAGLSAIFSLIGLFFKPSKDGGLSVLFDPWMMIDAALVTTLGFFVWRKYRVASVILVIYWIFAKVTIWIETGKPSGLVLAIIFLIYFITAMRATFIWQKNYARSKTNDLSSSVSNEQQK